MCGAPNTPKPPPPPQPAKPAITTPRRTDKRKTAGMGPSTLLTGPSGVANRSLNLGAGGNTMLGQ